MTPCVLTRPHRPHLSARGGTASEPRPWPFVPTGPTGPTFSRVRAYARVRALRNMCVRWGQRAEKPTNQDRKPGPTSTKKVGRRWGQWGRAWIGPDQGGQKGGDSEPSTAPDRLNPRPDDRSRALDGKAATTTASTHDRRTPLPSTPEAA